VALGYAKRFTRPDGTTFDTTNQITYDYKNPLKNFFETGRTIQNGLNYQAGNQNGSYFISGQVNNTTGTIPKDKADRYSIRLGASTNYNKFTSNFSIGYTRLQTDIAGVDYNQGRPVYWNVLNTPGEVDIKKFKDLNAPFANENDWYNAYYPNPYWQIENSRQKANRDDILGSVELGLKATSWLNFTYRVGATASNFQQKNTIAGVTFSSYEISDPFGAGNAGSSNPNGVKPKLYDRLNEKFIIQSDFLVNMNHKFLNNNLDARLLLGNSINKNSERDIQSGNGVNGGTGELEIPGLYNVSNLIASPTEVESTTKVGKIGAFGSLQLGWKNYLFLEVTGRNDWVSVLAPNNRSFFYPGVNASFVFTDAIKPLKDISWLTFGKLLASWTKVGNVSVGAYSLSNTFGQASGFPYNTTGFTLGNTLANPNLKPEMVKSREVGLQLAFLRSRINFQATYYNEDISDQTVPIQISFATGYSATRQNVGNVNNQGVELDLRLTPFLNLGPVKWNAGANVAFYKSHVDEIDPLVKSIFIGGFTTGAGIYTIEGQPMRVLQVTDWKRDSATGKVIVDPNTGRPSATSSVVNVGQSTPKVIIGLNTSFEYKSFALNILGEYRGGYVVYNNIGNATAFTGVSAITTATGRQRFIYPNSVILQNGKYVDNTTVAVDNASNGSSFWTSTYRQAGSNFVTSGDFWKVREVSLNYNIPFKGNKLITKASVGLVARNLFTFLPKDNIYADPEYSVVPSGTGGATGTGNAQGISNENLSPPTRIFGATLSISF
jgi:outer membrane receptor protein involved in Fe transport